MRPTILMLALVSGTLASSNSRPPIRHASVIEDASFYSRDARLKHDSTLELAFSTGSGKVHLELAPNLDLLGHGDSARFVFEDDFGDALKEEHIDARDYNVYKGHVLRSDSHQSVKIGKARILVHSTIPLVFEGSFTAHGRMHNIQLGQLYRGLGSPHDYGLEAADSDMVLWSDADLDHKLAKRSADSTWTEAESEAFCSTDALNHNLFQSSGPDLYRRQLSGDTGSSYITQAQLAATIGQTAGCPTQREVAVLGAAADCNFVSIFNSTASARSSIIAAFNSASSVYEDSFNISLGLGQIVISEASCPTTASTASPWNTACDSTTTIGDRLSQFSTWRGSQSDSYAAWSLLTTCNTGSEIGVAWLGTLCNANTTNQTDSVVSGTNVVAASTSGGSYWRTLAHELGHNFGASHDCTTSTCGTSTTCCPLTANTCPAGGQYLMNPSSSASSSAFSPCTIGQVCSNMLDKRITTSCLTTNQNVHLADGAASCGNGIVEEGEDCDCGGEAGCGNNSCCNPTTCKFNSGAVCDNEVSACCTSSCQFASANTTCRASTGVCDPAESCSGTSGTCPSDTFAKNGESCGSGLQCASGQCTSRTLQCQQQINGSRAPCDEDQCSLTCYVGSTCYIANQYFITGTPCGNGGFCDTGNCDQGSLGHQVESWFDSNKNWLIPVIAVVGGLVLLTVLYCLISGCVQDRKKKKKKKRTRTEPVPQMVYASQDYAPQPYQFQRPQAPSWQPQPQPQQYPHEHQAYGHAQQYNTWQPPQYPAQTYH